MLLHHLSEATESLTIATGIPMGFAIFNQGSWRVPLLECPYLSRVVRFPFHFDRMLDRIVHMGTPATWFRHSGTQAYVSHVRNRAGTPVVLLVGWMAVDRQAVINSASPLLAEQELADVAEVASALPTDPAIVERIVDLGARIMQTLVQNEDARDEISSYWQELNLFLQRPLLNPEEAVDGALTAFGRHLHGSSTRAIGFVGPGAQIRWVSADGPEANSVQKTADLSDIFPWVITHHESSESYDWAEPLRVFPVLTGESTRLCVAIPSKTKDFPTLVIYLLRHNAVGFTAQEIGFVEAVGTVLSRWLTRLHHTTQQQWRDLSSQLLRLAWATWPPRADPMSALDEAAGMASRLANRQVLIFLTEERRFFGTLAVEDCSALALELEEFRSLPPGKYHITHSKALRDTFTCWPLYRDDHTGSAPALAGWIVVRGTPFHGGRTDPKFMQILGEALGKFLTHNTSMKAMHDVVIDLWATRMILAEQKGSIPRRFHERVERLAGILARFVGLHGQALSVVSRGAAILLAGCAAIAPENPWDLYVKIAQPPISTGMLQSVLDWWSEQRVLAPVSSTLVEAFSHREAPELMQSLPAQVLRLASDYVGMMTTPNSLSVAEAFESLAARSAPRLDHNLVQHLKELIDQGELDDLVEKPADWKGTEGLTTREREVLQLISEGLQNRQIAQRLFISEATAKVHVRQILKKLNVPSRIHAVRLTRMENALLR